MEFSYWTTTPLGLSGLCGHRSSFERTTTGHHPGSTQVTTSWCFWFPSLFSPAVSLHLEHSCFPHGQFANCFCFASLGSSHLVVLLLPSVVVFIPTHLHHWFTNSVPSGYTYWWSNTLSWFSEPELNLQHVAAKFVPRLLLMVILADFDMVLLLFVGQESGHELCCDTGHVQIGCEDYLNCSS